MGCDIHIALEAKINGAWKNVNDIVVEKYEDEPDYHSITDAMTPRNYPAFGTFAGVRYPEVPGGQIAPRRGIPGDLAEQTKLCMQPDDPNLHSWTYLSLTDLLGFNINKSCPQSMNVLASVWIDKTPNYYTPRYQDVADSKAPVYSIEEAADAWSKVKNLHNLDQVHRRSTILGADSDSMRTLGIPHQAEHDFLRIISKGTITSLQDLAINWQWIQTPLEHFSEYYAFYVSRLTKEASKYNLSHDNVRMIIAFDN